MYVHHAVSFSFLHLFRKYLKVSVIALETTNQLAKNENIKAIISPFIFRLAPVPTMAEISKMLSKNYIVCTMYIIVAFFPLNP